MDRQLISIVVPMYNEAPNLKPLYKEITKYTRELPFRFELIFVDDGSTDDSSQIARSLASADKSVRLIGLSRNFGKEAAMTAGLHAAHGDAAVVMDADLQMPPSLLGKFIAKWKAGAEVVVGVFASRKTSRLRKFCSDTFYKIMQAIAHTEITPHSADYRLIDRRVVDEFNRMTEHNRITRGLIDWLGFKRDYIHFQQQERHSGKVNYSYRKLIQLAMNSFIAYSLVPLKLAGYLGAFILAVSLPTGVVMAINRFVFHWPIRGTAFLAILLVFLVGLVLVCMGLISLYIAAIHAEASNRPLYVVREDTARRQKSGVIELVEHAR